MKRVICNTDHKNTIPYAWNEVLDHVNSLLELAYELANTYWPDHIYGEAPHEYLSTYNFELITLSQLKTAVDTFLNSRGVSYEYYKLPFGDKFGHEISLRIYFDDIPDLPFTITLVTELTDDKLHGIHNIPVHSKLYYMDIGFIKWSRVYRLYHENAKYVHKYYTHEVQDVINRYFSD